MLQHTQKSTDQKSPGADRKRTDAWAWAVQVLICAVVAACGVFGTSYVVGYGWPVLPLAAEILLSVLLTPVVFGICLLIERGVGRLAEGDVSDSALNSVADSADGSFAETGAGAKHVRVFLGRLVPSWNVKSILMFAAVMAVFWLPWLIANFPGSTYWDTYYQIYQVYPENHPIAVIPWEEIYSQTLTDAWLVDHHPVLTTLIYGLFGWTSDQLTGNWMVGIFVFVCLQGIAYVIVFSASVAYMARVGCLKAVCAVAYLFFCFMPFIPTWSLCMVKDSLFGLFFVPYFLLLFEAVRTHGVSCGRPRQVLLLTVCALMLCLTKKTGLFVVVLTAAVLAIWIAVRNGSTDRRAVRFGVEGSGEGSSEAAAGNGVSRRIFGCLCPAIVSVAVAGLLLPIALFPALNIEPGGKQEVFGTLFQQTARYLVDHGDDVSAEEEVAIAKVLDFDKLVGEYKFDFEDSVKYRYNLDATGEDMADYLRVYIAQGLRHPDSYFAAVASLAGFYVAPTSYVNIRMVTVDTKMGNGADKRYMLWNPEELDWLREGLDNAYRAVALVPVLDLPLLTVTYALWLPAALAFVVVRRRLRALPLFVPFLVLLAFCIVAPVFDARYIVPMLDTTPLLFCVVCTLMRSQNALTLPKEQRPESSRQQEKVQKEKTERA